TTHVKETASTLQSPADIATNLQPDYTASDLAQELLESTDGETDIPVDILRRIIAREGLLADCGACFQYVHHVEACPEDLCGTCERRTNDCTCDDQWEARKEAEL